MLQLLGFHVGLDCDIVNKKTIFYILGEKKPSKNKIFLLFEIQYYKVGTSRPINQVFNIAVMT